MPRLIRERVNIGDFLAAVQPQQARDRVRRGRRRQHHPIRARGTHRASGSSIALVTLWPLFAWGGADELPLLSVGVPDACFTDGHAPTSGTSAGSISFGIPLPVETQSPLSSSHIHEV